MTVHYKGFTIIAYNDQWYVFRAGAPCPCYQDYSREYCETWVDGQVMRGG